MVAARDTSKNKMLEEFARRITAKAREMSGRLNLGDPYHAKGFWRFACPLPGHEYNGDYQTWLTIGPDGLQAGCPKCLGSDDRKGTDAQTAYTARLKELGEWDDTQNVVAFERRRGEERSHEFLTYDGRHIVRHTKFTPTNKDGSPRKGARAAWGYTWRALDEGKFGSWVRGDGEKSAGDRLLERYPECANLYLLLRWYRHDLLADHEQATVLITEGEKDADSLNALASAAGRLDDVIATTLCIQGPRDLASHQTAAMRGRRVAVIMDADRAGSDHEDRWVGALWDAAESITRYPATQFGFPENDRKDLTDWIARESDAGRTPQEIIDDLMHRLAETPAEVDPPKREGSWRGLLVYSQKGGVKEGSTRNAEVIWTEHPDIAGKIRRDVHTGEVELIEPPWGGPTVVTARKVSNLTAAWLERSFRLSLSHRVLREMLEDLAPPYNRFQWLLDASWDGTAAISGLTRDVPLDTAPKFALQVWEVVTADLVRKLKGDHWTQRLLLGMRCDYPYDVAHALAGDWGAVHTGNLSLRQVVDYARAGKLLVQLDLDVVANQQKANIALTHAFEPFVDVRPGEPVPTPLFIAVGPGTARRTVERADPRVYIFDLDGEPRLQGLGEVFREALIEAKDRLGDSYHAPLPDKKTAHTVGREEQIESLSFMARALIYYVTRDLPLGARAVLDPATIYSAGFREEPLRHVIREQFLHTMHSFLYGTYKGNQDAMEVEFNKLARFMGWASKNRRPRVNLTPGIATKLGWRVDFPDSQTKDEAGIRLAKTDLENLQKIFEHGETCFAEPDNTGLATPEKNLAPCLADANTLNNNSLATLANSLSPIRGEGSFNNEKMPRAPARVRAYLSQDSQTALGVVREILSQPGYCALDFETWPTDPTWHGDQAAAGAARGDKARAREQATLHAQTEARAHKRVPCTLQLHHESGDEVFVQLDRGGTEQFLRQAFVDAQAALVAHNAQFETEILVRHGVHIDVECTLLAAKALYLTAVGPDRPQPVSFSLAALVERETGRQRDKSIRERDWRRDDSIDDEAIEYGLQDCRDALELWQIYEARLREEDLLDGYKVIQQAFPPTATINITGLTVDRSGHSVLISSMETEARTVERELDALSMGDISNHGSTQQISDWIVSEVMRRPVRVPSRPDVVSLIPFLRAKGGLASDRGGELRARDLPHGLVRLDGLTLEDATVAAWEAGYLGHLDALAQDNQGIRPEERDLLAALDREIGGDLVFSEQDQQAWDDYQAMMAHYEAAGAERAEIMPKFQIRLMASTGVKGWRTTKTGHLQISKGSKLRKAEQLRNAYPEIAEYLVAHARWNKATKLIEAFGPTFGQWIDEDGRARGQFKVGGTVTLRHTCTSPNLQQIPRTDAFRALFRAASGRKLVVCDYSQIELRLAAIIAPDERLLDVYRENRDVHLENARIIFDRKEVTKEERQLAKPCGFGVVYGSGAVGLSEAAGVDLAEAHTFLARFLGAYQGLAEYRERAPREAERLGYISIRPHRRVLYDPSMGLGTTAINYPVQGGAASVQMRALRLVHEVLATRPELDTRLAASIHDEILLDAPADERAEEVKTILEAQMRTGLIEIFPEAVEMGADELAEAAVVDRWDQKP